MMIAATIKMIIISSIAYFTDDNAYSALMLLFERAISEHITVTITITAASPAKAAPTLRDDGDVISVPIVYTRYEIVYPTLS